MQSNKSVPSSVNQSKHTPGPWKTSHELNDGFSIVRQIGEGNNLLPVAIAVFTRNYNTENIEVAKANARLIASAPELLEACKKVLAEFKKLNPPYLLPTIDLLANAIAKAEGK